MLINLTPHSITLRRSQGDEVAVPPSGTVARVAATPGGLGDGAIRDESGRVIAVTSLVRGGT
jgi:hypothetical protein